MTKTLNRTSPMTRETKKKRVFEIDLIRGLCIFMMIIDHFFYDWGYLFVSIFGISMTTTGMANNPAWLNTLVQTGQWRRNWEVRYYTRQVIVSLFLFVCGLSANFSKNNLERGMKIFALGILITAVTELAGASIPFGTLSSIGVSIIVFSLFELLMDKVDKKREYSPYIYMVIGAIFAIFGYAILQTRNASSYSPTFDGTLWENILRIMIGTKRTGDDWLAIFPFIGFLFIGAGLSYTVYKNKKSLFEYIPKKYRIYSYIDGDHLSYYPNKAAYYSFQPVYYFFEFFSFIGRYTLIIYIGHQVILVLIGGIILLCNGYSLKLSL